MSELVDISNSNNHAGIKRVEDAEKAEALLKIINEYRVHTTMYESLPTWDVLEFLQKLDDEVNERYNKEVQNAERDKIKEQYFLLTHKKPFGWRTNERLLEEIEKFKANNSKTVAESHLIVKKNEWKNVLRKK